MGTRFVTLPCSSISLTHHFPQFLVRCTKPSQKGLRATFSQPPTLADVFLRALEFIQISKAVAIGFAVMGFIGYLVKLIHIPM
jgi:hypothetical protein